MNIRNAAGHSLGAQASLPASLGEKNKNSARRATPRPAGKAACAPRSKPRRFFSTLRLSLGFVCCLLAPINVTTKVVADDDWSRFRGPNGSGLSTSTNLPNEFGAEKNVVWKTLLPPGHSSPVLTRTRIFVTAHTPIKDKTKDKDNYQLFVIALDRQTGKTLWQREVPRVNKVRLENVNGPASPSPVTDGTNVYAFFQDFGMIAFDADGKEKWRLPLGPFNMFYGFGASP